MSLNVSRRHKDTRIPDGPSCLHSSTRLRQRLDSAAGENKVKVRVGDVILGWTGVRRGCDGRRGRFESTSEREARDRRLCMVVQGCGEDAGCRVRCCAMTCVTGGGGEMEGRSGRLAGKECLAARYVTDEGAH